LKGCSAIFDIAELIRKRCAINIMGLIEEKKKWLMQEYTGEIFSR